jgi:putative two-component system response regulator
MAQMQRVLKDMQILLEERNRHFKALSRSHREALVHLALAAESRDGDTGLHIVRIGQLAGLLALLITGDMAYAEQMCQAAPLHDVGKIGIPDSVLKKPGPLTPEEWTIMHAHPSIGARILGGSEHPLFTLAAEIAQNHHEKFDGGGYPAGLSGEAIPASARIVAIVDYYDALTMARVYRPCIPEEEVLEMMHAERGRKFDPAIVDVFFANADKLRTLRDRVNTVFADCCLDTAGAAIFEPLFQA